jgi:hypothetical protein
MAAHLEVRLEILDRREDEEIGPLIVSASPRPDAGHDVIGELQLVHRRTSAR